MPTKCVGQAFSDTDVLAIAADCLAYMPRPVLVTQKHMVYGCVAGRDWSSVGSIKPVASEPGRWRAYLEKFPDVAIAEFPEPLSVGDLIWVKEAWYQQSDHLGMLMLYRADRAAFHDWRDGLLGLCGNEALRADFNPLQPPDDCNEYDVLKPQWRLATGMPRWFARHLLAVTSVEVVLDQENQQVMAAKWWMWQFHVRRLTGQELVDAQAQQELKP